MNYYELLEIRNDASNEVVKMAYKALIRKYHPDVYKGDIDFSNAIMCELNAAYEVLSDPIKRRNYDAMLNSGADFHQASAEPPNNGNSDDSANHVEIGMEWFAFYTNVYMCVGCLFGAKSIIGSLIDDSIRSMLLSGQSASLIVWGALLIDVLVVVTQGYLWLGLREFSSKSFKINMIFIMVLPVIYTITLMDYNSETPLKEMFTFLAVCVPISALNIIYFLKRAFLFDDILIKYNMRRAVKMISILLATALITCSAYYYLCTHLDARYVGSFEAAEDTPTDVVQKNFNKLARICEFGSAYNMVEAIEKNGNISLDEYTVSERYEYIATEIFELSSYDDAVGTIDPNNDTMIENFEDYQNYVYTAYAESIMDQ